MAGEQSGTLPSPTPITSEDVRAWQIGSKGPPTVCLCCGTKFDDGPHKLRGPYNSGPYIYVCDGCWSKPFLFFPDKEITEDGLTKVPRIVELESRKTAVEFSALGSTVRLFVTPEAALDGQIVEIELNGLSLDSNNVRFRDRKRALEDHELEEVIWSEPTTKNLMREILASRGLSEMPIVDSRMVVREGNRRTVCLRRLSKLAHEEKLVGVRPDTFDKVRIIVLRPDVKETEIALYLARIHVGGKRQWMAVNKAAHVFELHSRDGMSFEQMWKFLSINRSMAERMINAYRDTLHYREKYPDEKGWAGKYSYFDEMYKNVELREWIQRKRNKKRLMDWIYRERIRKGADIRKLPVVLTDKYATQLLSKSNLDKAYSYLAKKDPRLADEFYRRISEVTNEIRKLKAKQVLLAAEDPNRISIVESLSQSAIRLNKSLENARKSSTGKRR